jgi:transglutaminase-like putative cysteine protease
MKATAAPPTATAAPPTATAAPPTPPANAETPLPRIGHPATRRTLLALLACALGATPLKALLSDSRWLGDAWLAMIVVVAPAALLRLRRAPSALDVWPGVVLLVPWLTWLYLPDHAWGGFIPTRATMHDIGHLMDDLHRTTTDQVAPIHSTIAVRLVISALLGLLVALIDLIAVVGRRGALAGVPLLVVYTVSGAVPRNPVAWFWFGVAAAGYLILLALDAPDELREWGRRVSRPGAAWSRQGLGFSAQRIGIVAILVAIVVPVVLPSHPHNLLADAFRHRGEGGVGSLGAGDGGGSISPFAALKGQLQRDHPVELMKVHIDSDQEVRPFYARSNVLDKFTGSGWVEGSHGATEPTQTTAFSTLPSTPEPNTQSYIADITITGLSGNPPVFSTPRSVQGIGSDAEWNPQDQLLLGGSVQRGDEFLEDVAQPEPSVADLEASPSLAGVDASRWLDLPPLPDAVTRLVNQLTRGRTTLYQKTRAIFDYFADPKNGFVYSLHTNKGDSGNDLVDFLENRSGFCQQYAAAMGVLLRAAGVPARVVLGYMHPAPDAIGDFTITTFDAHAWVEAFFPGSGWIPFDPTPTAGLVGGRRTDLPWALHSYSADNGDNRPTISTSPAHPRGSSAAPGGNNETQPSAGSQSSSHLALIVTGLVLLLLAGIALLPATVRAARRRRRLAAAREGDPDALWAELSDTALDLGYVWSPARTPRQVSAWLAHDAADTAPALDALAVAVEHRRYAPHPQPTDTASLTRGFLDVTDQLWSRRSGRARLWARFWPASLGWGERVGAARSSMRRKRH